MPHLRNRYLCEIIKKRLSFFPVVAIQGARQVGKSALVRNLLPQDLKDFRYETFDQPSVLQFAKENPESFVAGRMSPTGTLAIDEAQKVPDIFDTVKFYVDKNPRPGQFILLGSTEFSKRTLIRESLTGRMAMVRLFPFTISEALQLDNPVIESSLCIHLAPRTSREQLLKHLDNGGMPGAFHIREEMVREVFFKEWLGLVILRDLMLIPRVKLDPNLAEEILRQIATNPEPSIGNIAKTLSKDSRRIKAHIESLEALFIIHKLPPFQSGTGQPIYLHCDVGLATFLGANFQRRLQTWVYQELLANAEWRSDVHEKIFYYRSPKGGLLHFVLETKQRITAVKIIAKEAVTLLDLKLLESFRQKHNQKNVRLVALGPTRRDFESQNVEMYPWESLA
jgi:predicted AAA+ superfamily ATPase